MSSCMEFEGKAIEDAVDKASEVLKIPKDQIKYNVISHGSSGIFGLVGVKKAKICVFLPEEPEVKPEKPQKSERPQKQEKSEQTEKSERPEKSEPAQPAEQNRRKPGRTDEPVEKPFTHALPEHMAKMTEEELLSQNCIQKGRDVLQRIVDFITTGAVVTPKKGEDRVMFNIEGGDTGILIGKRGQTLEAIQYIVEKVVNKGSDERIRIQIDVEGYLENRRSNLESLARRLADKAKHTGKPSTLGQMNAHDRRIVHLTLKDDAEVRTQSMGEGFYRKLVIIPKRKMFRKKKPY